MLYHSAEIFDGAQYLYSTPDYNGDPNIYRWNYFYTPVQIGEETVGVRIAVRDLKQTTHSTPESQIYNWGIKRGASVDGGSPGQSPLSSGVSLDAPGKPVSLDGGGRGLKVASPRVSSDVPSMDSIPQTTQNVNPELAQQAEKPGQTGTLLAEVYDLARRMGACGQKGLSDALGVRKLGGDFNETDFLIGYIDVYLAALNGVPHGPAYLPATVDSHARRLSLVERMQAYHNGLNDAKARTQATQNVNPETGIPQVEGVEPEQKAGGKALYTDENKVSFAPKGIEIQGGEKFEPKQAVASALKRLEKSSGIRDNIGVLRYYAENTELVETRGMPAAIGYDAEEDVIRFNPDGFLPDGVDKDGVFLHELSHRADKLLYIIAQHSGFADAIKEASALVASNPERIRKMFCDGGVYKDNAFLSDVISALSKGEIAVPYGHDKTYWDIPFNVEHEVFANLSAIDAIMGLDSVSSMKEIGRLLEVFRSIISEGGIQ